MTIRLAIVNDYEVVVHGLAAMLRSYSHRVSVVEVDASVHPTSSVDIALFDTFAQSFRDRERIARLVSDPGIAKVVVYTWSADDPAVNQTRVPGISAYVSKRLAAAELVDALERIHSGQTVPLEDSGRGRPASPRCCR
jgi:DNA-binding NarL/FixJ family response regulator